ncbi:hypothetical protein [Parahaliea mediterranea]|uniref:hypothetical protein n=1 Tax=Parahaliea mediterranea TaxID=651086 RepID=UPI000E2FB06C|nr:hypothetical protein [Parahaliea mediterranea]
MKPSDLYHALAYTRERGDFKDLTQIEHTGDRNRLAILLTRDADVITDLLQDAIADLNESELNNVTSAAEALYSGNVGRIARVGVWGAMLGTDLLQKLPGIIDTYIDSAAEEWLDLAYQYKVSITDPAADHADSVVQERLEVAHG